MNDAGTDAAIRRAIGGDAVTIAAILAGADTVDDAVTIAMAALLRDDPRGLGRADSVATTSRDRQVVAITRAHLAGDSELVDALARDHLVSFPDSLIVSWIASK
jgi:hypothetical protein